MGHKVNPRIFQIGTFGRTWSSTWFARGKSYADAVKEDHAIRKFIHSRLSEGGLDAVHIERTVKEIEVILHVARPGVVIGRGGAKIDELKSELETLLKNKKRLKVTIKEVPKMYLSAMVLVREIASQIERRIPYRRVMKGVIEQSMKAGAKGAKVVVAGRLNGAEIARRETLKQGKLPMGTLRSDIDYARGASHTTYGTIGIKVWVYKGEKFEQGPSAEHEAIA